MTLPSEPTQFALTWSTCHFRQAESSKGSSNGGSDCDPFHLDRYRGYFQAQEQDQPKAPTQEVLLEHEPEVQQMTPEAKKSVKSFLSSESGGSDPFYLEKYRRHFCSNPRHLASKMPSFSIYKINNEVADEGVRCNTAQANGIMNSQRVVLPINIPVQQTGTRAITHNEEQRAGEADVNRYAASPSVHNNNDNENNHEVGRINIEQGGEGASREALAEPEIFPMDKSETPTIRHLVTQSGGRNRTYTDHNSPMRRSNSSANNWPSSGLGEPLEPLNPLGALEPILPPILPPTPDHRLSLYYLEQWLEASASQAEES
ncbi:hypothetical protein BKA67DRAFT_692134 [Truncatella angustata]|uniref:Uncharacterized protein n=1 Tax=Truncatella angustata TaxID=152316 RepID=A0A9P8UIT0_9PEZI|nr:uncharacterized protein BKA67DRAFT_692134 [Truncatella angustata]KAH6652835.1 hypothetical protein BKA67DRAFT_692134 [Truncatella angustata]KAH8198303.1 hypothetical protein TruAng_007553 [Truncatella angustata]